MRTDEAVTPPTWLQHTWRWGYYDIGPHWFADPDHPDHSAALVAKSMKEAGADALVVAFRSRTGQAGEQRTRVGLTTSGGLTYD